METRYLYKTNIEIITIDYDPITDIFCTEFRCGKQVLRFWLTNSVIDELTHSDLPLLRKAIIARFDGIDDGDE